jgi:CDP-L-myo-inositol myo-inositolphosphotransferase
MSKKDGFKNGGTGAFPAVILAAGKGSRMKAGIPKPLIKLLGLTLLERALLTCREAGISEFYVVVGYKKREVLRHVKELMKKYELNIKVVENPEWKKGNGTSVLAVSKQLKSPFFLLMCDHVFDPEIVEKFVETARFSNTCLLSVDKKIDRVVDLEEATKVKMKDGTIISIGKELKDFDAVDMGLFFCQPCIFDAIKKSVEKGDASLIGGIKILAEKRKIKGIEAEGKFWIDADTKRNLKIAEKLLLSDLIKDEDGYISRYINRKISTKISRVLCNFNITPNAITLISFILSIFAAFLFIHTQYIYILLGGIITQVASIIDGCDGEIARLKFQSSPFGAWLDTVLDRYADVLITISITYACWLIYENVIVWIIGIAAITGFILTSYMKKEYVLRYNKNWPDGIMDKLSKRDLRLFGIFVGAILFYPLEAIAILAIISHISIIWGFLREKWLVNHR